MCVCNRSKCAGFTVCFTYSNISLSMSINQYQINVELPYLWYIVVLLPQKRFSSDFGGFWVHPLRFLIIEGQGRYSCFERAPAPEQFSLRKLHHFAFKLRVNKVKRFTLLLVPSNKLQIHWKSLEVALEGNWNPTVFEPSKCVAWFIGASQKLSHWLPLFDWMLLNNKRLPILLSLPLLQKEAMSGTVSGRHVWILLCILTIQKLWDFNFLQGLPPDLLDEFSMRRYEKKLESFDLRGDAIFCGKLLQCFSPFKTRIPRLFFLLLGAVNGELKILQNRSKKTCLRQKDADIQQVR